MASTADFRNGMVIEIDGDLWAIAYFQHVKPGKGGAFVRTKLKNVLTGAVVERTYRAGEKVTDVRLQRRPVNYSYSDGDLYYFMDANSFDLIPLSGDLLGDTQLKYLKENMACEGLVHDGRVISVELPQFVELEVGGGFGIRGEFYPEDLLVPWTAMRLGRPVQWIEDRREHLMAANHSRQQWHETELGFDRDGRIVALQSDMDAASGAAWGKVLAAGGFEVPAGAFGN